MTDTMAKLNQIISLVWWIQTYSTYITVLKLNGNRDYCSVKITNQNGIEKYVKNIDALTKKHDAILLKEFQQIIDNLIILKNEIENE